MRTKFRIKFLNLSINFGFFFIPFDFWLFFLFCTFPVFQQQKQHHYDLHFIRCRYCGKTTIFCFFFPSPPFWAPFSFCSFFSPRFFFVKLFTDTFFTLDVYLGHGDTVRVVDPELGKLERENVGHEHGISLNSPILGTTSTSSRRHTRRESNPGNYNNVLYPLIHDLN